MPKTELSSALEKEKSRILVIDDDANIRKGVIEVLSIYGYEVEDAEDGLQGLEMYSLKSYHAVLIDLFMPGMNGVDVLKRMNQKNKDLPKIVITGYPSMDSTLQALNLGAFGYITKPFRLEELRTMVNNAVQQYKLGLQNKFLLAELSEKNQELEEINLKLNEKINEATFELKNANEDLLIKRQELEELNIQLLDQNSWLQNKMSESDGLHAIIKRIQGRFDLNEIYRMCSEGIHDLAGFQRVLISRREGDYTIRKYAYGISEDDFEHLKSQKVPLLKIESMIQESYRLQPNFEVFYIPHDAASHPQEYALPSKRLHDIIKNWHAHDLVIIPLREQKGEIVGTISVDDPSEPEFHPKDTVSVLQNFADYTSLAIKNALTYIDLDSINRELEVLLEIGRRLTSQEDLNQLLHSIATETCDLLQAEGVTIYLYDENKKELRSSVILNRILHDISDEVILKLGQGIAGKVAKTGQMVNISSKATSVGQEKDLSDFSEIFDKKYKYETRNLLCEALKYHAQIIGVIEVINKEKEDFNEKDERSLSTLASFASIAIQKLNLSITDGLTELYNHRYFQETLERELSRMERYKTPLSLIMIDIDHFKFYNDAFGHPAGDKVLQEISKILTNTVRRSDLVARYGGEEFAIVMPQTDKESAMLMARRIRDKIELAKFSKEEILPSGRLTISLGIATYPADAKDQKSLIELTDKALYRAKAEGRNRLCAYSSCDNSGDVN